MVGHANAEHRTHAEKRIGLVGWSAVTSRYGETGFILWEVCSEGSHSDPWSSSSLPGESSVHGRWLGKSCLASPLEVFPGHSLKAFHSPHSAFLGCRYLGQSNCWLICYIFHYSRQARTEPTLSILSKGRKVVSQYSKSQRPSWGHGKCCGLGDRRHSF